MSAGHGFLGAHDTADADVTVIGVPYGHGSARPSGTMHAPRTLRALTQGEDIEAGIWDYSSRQKVLTRLRLSDMGDMIFRPSMDRAEYFRSMEVTARRLGERKIVSLAIGGDHTVTLPLASGIACAYRGIQVVQLDAHHDYTAMREGLGPTHSNFIGFLARHSEIKRIVQIGVRGFSSLLPEAPPDVVESSIARLDGFLISGMPTYLTVDTDAFDPALAPAVAHPMPRGLKWEDLDTVIDALLRLKCQIVGIDWTEYDPDLDGPNFSTGMAIVCAVIRVLQAVECQRA